MAVWPARNQERHGSTFAPCGTAAAEPSLDERVDEERCEAEKERGVEPLDRSRRRVVGKSAIGSHADDESGEGQRQREPAQNDYRWSKSSEPESHAGPDMYKEDQEGR